MCRRSLVIWMLVLAIFAEASCTRETDDDKVKKVITSVQKAAEEKQISAVLDNLSKSYRDPQGNDYNAIKGLLAFYFFRHQKVSVYMPNIDIVVTGSTAKALFQAVMTGRGPEGGGVLPDALGAYNFEVQLKKEDGAWKVTSAKWERVGEGGVPPQ